MPKVLTSTFEDALRAQGLFPQLPVRWYADGTLFLDELTEEQRAAVMAVYDAYDPDAKPPASFLARELIAQLTPEDQANIAIELDDELAAAKSAKAGGKVPATPLRLLWSALQAQGDTPIDTGSARFQQGWAALSQVLRADRSAAIAAALGIV